MSGGEREGGGEGAESRRGMKRFERALEEEGVNIGMREDGKILERCRVYLFFFNDKMFVWSLCLCLMTILHLVSESVSVG